MSSLVKKIREDGTIVTTVPLYVSIDNVDNGGHTENVSLIKVLKASHFFTFQVLKSAGKATPSVHKGNSVVVLLDSREYNRKVNTCIESIGATIDPSFDFDEYNKNVRKEIKKSEYILDKEPRKKSTLVSNPQTSRLYGLPKKIHTGYADSFSSQS